MVEATEIIYWICGGLAAFAALLTVIRLGLGPTILDRAVAVDLLTAVAIAVVVLVIVWQGRADLSVLLVIFALTGFFSSVAIARFVDKERPGERSILSPEEAARQLQKLRDEEERQLLKEKALADEADKRQRGDNA